MNYEIQSQNGVLKLPHTAVFNEMSSDLLIFIRSWCGEDLQQKVLSEITRYLSATDADLEVTSPFEYVENLSSVANKARVALLMANEALYGENKDQHKYGYEVALCYKKSNEICIASVGRFSFKYQKKNKMIQLYESAGFADDLTLLPSQLLGIEKSIEIKISSISKSDLEVVEIKSIFDDETYWISQIKNF